MTLGLGLVPSGAFATPSTTYWAPSTAACQAFAVPHITYDTYYGKGPLAGAAGAPNFPIDTGLTIGFIPGSKLQGEFGYDVLLPSQDPVQFFLNAKVCATESALFKGSPGISVGFYNLGFKKDVTDYNALHVMFQKSIPGGGYVAAGFYHGMSDVLFTNSDGEIKKNGAMVGFFSPNINVGLKGLKKINFAADVQTGKNIAGAWGVGTYFYFTDTISLLIGPVFYLDERLQPGGAKHLWTTQIDIDIPFGK